MATTFLGPYDVVATRTKEGHREYKVKSRVGCAKTDGPRNVMLCPGLYAVGSTYHIDSDSDPWAFCWPTMSITRAPGTRDGAHPLVFNVEQTFSTEPLWRCNSTPIEDPLQEPIKLSGSFVKYTREALLDKNGNGITNSAWEPFRGQQNEWDFNRPTVHVEMNQAALGLATFSAMIDTVNNATLWGLPSRCIKLSNASWERKLFGVCSYYYTVGYDFDVMYESFDRTLLDSGNKALNGHWVNNAVLGTGCTVAITAGSGGNAGPITAVALGAGGANYPKDSSFGLFLTSGTGTAGSVIATTTADVVTSVVLNNPGARYVSATVSTTGSRWVLDKINGAPPNPNNPGHFISFKDPNGELTEALLDGHGLPWDPTVSGSNSYPGSRFVQFYEESNFLTLGVPTTL